ncbi:MAG: hypothetical protein KGI41_00010 [Patescibacteria group bacterium]|nr:hypothetical protein [Patescibacteria group bacterium]MDE1965621.1 hypothetical protein [Patescibacteria group bacterium]
MPNRPVLDIRRPHVEKPPIRRRDLDVLPRSGSQGAPRAGTRLHERRRRHRKALAIALGVFAFLLVVAAFWGLWRPAVRVTGIALTGTDAASLEPLVASELTGTYFWVIPRDSIFFLPEGSIRAALLAARPDVGAVSISRTGFHSISVALLPRVDAYLWCGTDDAVATSSESVMPDGSAPCYASDPQGFLFASMPGTAASTTEPVGVDAPLFDTRVYAPIDLAVPLRAHVLSAAQISRALQFARSLSTFGANPVSLVLRGDEADLFLAGGTRVTYVLGDEVAASALAASAFPSLTLTDGSIEYVDLRFPGKVYLKKRQ